MKSNLVLLSALAFITGCTTNSIPANKDLTTESTLNLCRIVIANKNVDTQNKAASILIKRKTTPEKCISLIQSDNTMAASIAVAGAAVAVGAVAANNGGYGGGYYPPSGSYGVAWDQFYNQNRQLIWRCRDKATGQFVYDYHCASLPKVDSTWPGW